MVSDGTRLAELGVFARDTVGLQRGVEAECELKHYVDEEGRGLRPRVTGRRKVGVKGAATLLDRSFSIISCPPTARSRGRLLQISDEYILGRDDDESKAASGGRRGSRKMRWGGYEMCSGAVFSRL